MTGQLTQKAPLWIPSDERKQDANLTRFIQEVKTRHQLGLKSYAELYQWSVDHIPDFWEAVWDFAEINASRP